MQGLLVGSILAATDGPAVFALLRAVELRPRVAAVLEGETGMVDPVAVLLVVACIALIDTPGYGAVEIVELFARELSIGAVVGIAAGWLGRQALQRSAGMPDSLHLVGSIAIVALSFGGAATLHGSGFLAAYLAGLVFASGGLPARRSILAFHEGLASVADIALFLALGLLVFPAQLGSIALEGTLLALILAFVARPAAAALATAFEPFDARERIVIGWAGLRGALPVFLATFPVTAGIPRSIEFFNIVFFAVLVSTLIQGATIEPLARRLGVTAKPAVRRGVGSAAHGHPAPAGAS